MPKRLTQLFREIANHDRFNFEAADLARVEGRVMEVVLKEVAVAAVPAMSFSQRVMEAGRIFVPVQGIQSLSRAMSYAAVAVLALVGGGAVSAQAYAGALPGDAMYAVRGLVERAQLAVAPTAIYKARLLSDIADRRADDIARLVEVSANPGTIAVATNAFADTANQLASSLETASVGNGAEAVELAKTIERRTTGQQATLQRAGRLADADAKLAIAQAVRHSERLTIRALAVLVDQHVGGNAAAPRSVVLVNLEDRIASTEARVQDAATDNLTADRGARTAQAKVAIEEAKKLVSQDHFQAALVKIEEAAELAKEPEPEVVADPAVTPVKDPTVMVPVSEPATVEPVPNQTPTPAPAPTPIAEPAPVDEPTTSAPGTIQTIETPIEPVTSETVPVTTNAPTP